VVWMAKFQLWQADNEEWRWRLKALNGEIVCWAEGYTRKESAVDSIAWVRKYARDAEFEEL